MTRACAKKCAVAGVPRGFFADDALCEAEIAARVRMKIEAFARFAGHKIIREIRAEKNTRPRNGAVADFSFRCDSGCSVFEKNSGFEIGSRGIPSRNF
jgi:hypothetical protein